MPVTRRGLVAPQNTFLENIVRRCNGSRMNAATDAAAFFIQSFKMRLDN